MDPMLPLYIVTLFALVIIMFVIICFFVLHTLAILGIGRGSPFTHENVASQRIWKGDASFLAMAISAMILFLVLYLILS
jgi:hypothetical protein